MVKPTLLTKEKVENRIYCSAEGGLNDPLTLNNILGSPPFPPSVAWG